MRDLKITKILFKFKTLVSCWPVYASETKTSHLAMGDFKHTDATCGMKESMVQADSTDSWSRVAGYY